MSALFCGKFVFLTPLCCIFIVNKPNIKLSAKKNYSNILYKGKLSLSQNVSFNPFALYCTSSLSDNGAVFGPESRPFISFP